MLSVWFFQSWRIEPNRVIDDASLPIRLPIVKLSVIKQTVHRQGQRYRKDFMSDTLYISRPPFKGTFQTALVMNSTRPNSE